MAEILGCPVSTVKSRVYRLDLLKETPRLWLEIRRMSRGGTADGTRSNLTNT
jgi:hypothetical protein